MFELGGYELVVVVIIGLLVLGPEKLPQVMKMVSRAFRDLQKYANALKRDLNEDVIAPIRQAQQEIKQVKNEIPRVSANDLIEPDEILDQEDISYVQDAVESIKRGSLPDEPTDVSTGPKEADTEPSAHPPD